MILSSTKTRALLVLLTVFVTVAGSIICGAQGTYILGEKIDPAKKLHLPAGYAVEVYYQSSMAGVDAIAHGANGGSKIFVQQKAFDDTSRLSRLDTSVGKQQNPVPIALKSSLQTGSVSKIIGGPGDTCFVRVGNTIWQIDANGNCTEWNTQCAGTPKYWYKAKDGTEHLLGCDHNGKKVLEFTKDTKTAKGKFEELATGFANIDTITAKKDGTIYVSDREAGTIYTIQNKKPTTILTHYTSQDKKERYRLKINEPLSLRVGPDDELYLNSIATGFVRIAYDSEKKTWDVDYTVRCGKDPMPAGDFVFTSQQEVVFVSPADSAVTRVKLNPTNQTKTMTNLIRSTPTNTTAMCIGPGGKLFVGIKGHTASSSKIVCIPEKGKTVNVATGFNGEIRDIVFSAPQGQQALAYLFVATFFESGSGSSSTITRVICKLDKNAGCYKEVESPRVRHTVDRLPGNQFASLAVDLQHKVYATSGTAILCYTYNASTKRYNKQEYPMKIAETIRNESNNALRALNEFIIAGASDGTLYAFVSEGSAQGGTTREETSRRWLLKTGDLSKGELTILGRPLDYKGSGCMGNLCVDPTNKNTFWLIFGPEDALYGYTYDASKKKLKTFRPGEDGQAYFTKPRELPTDPRSVAVDKKGNLFIATRTGILRIYKK